MERPTVWLSELAESPEQPTTLVVHETQPTARVSQDIAVARLRWFRDAFRAAREPARVRALCGDLLNALTELLPGAAKAGLKIIQAIDCYVANSSEGPSEIVDALQTALDEPTREWMANEFEQVKNILDQSLVMLARLQSSSDVQRPTALFEGPRRMPAKPVAFFRGRDDELVELEQLLLDNRTVCVVATGIGGIGKTTLAEEFVATRAPEQFPDGVAWLDGRELIAELGRIVRRFGWADNREATPPEALSLLGQQLHTQRFLLVVDNFDPAKGDPEHVPSPGGQCRTLVTSRSRPLASRLIAAQLELAVWDLDACREYLRERCPRLQSEADAEVDLLAEFVGRLPLGVRLLVSVLNNRRGLGAASVLKLLKQQPLGVLDKYEADRGVAATFQVSYESLTDVGRRVLQALAVCAKQTRAAVVGAVAEVDDADEALDDLHARGLAEFAAEASAAAPWGLHDVVRLFVAEQRGREKFEASHEVWVRRHLKAHSKPTAHREFSTGVDEARVVFERWVERDPEKVEPVHQLLQAHLTVAGRSLEAIRLSEAMVVATPPDSALASDAIGWLGISYLALGDVSKAIGLHERALAVNEKLGRFDGQANSLGNLACCHQQFGNIPKAIDLFERALALHEKLGLFDGQANDLGNLGTCYRDLGDVTKAIDLLGRALALHEKLGNLEGQAIGHAQLGVCYRIFSDIPKAIDLFERALTIDEKLGRLVGQASVLSNLGGCHHTLGDIPKATDLFERALALYEKLGSFEGQAACLGNLGFIAITHGDATKCRQYLTRVVVLFDRNAFPEEHPRLQMVRRMLTEFASHEARTSSVNSE